MINFPEKMTPELRRLCENSQPISRQFSYDKAEENSNSPSLNDPIGDAIKSPCTGLVHRYTNRVLLFLNMSCPSNCRFCFRKEKVDAHTVLSNDDLTAALNYVENHPEITELIFSGGEPLVDYSRLWNTVTKLSKIKHLKSIRIHTRLPLTSPKLAEKIDFSRLKSPLPIYMVIHCNHSDEITKNWSSFVEKARNNNLILLSQTVLLKTVNADAQTLAELFQKLISVGVMPYYLHHPDQVHGTDHFRVSLAAGRAIYRQLRPLISGIAMPTYILDLPNGHGKVPATDAWLKSTEGNAYTVETNGKTINYRES